MKISTGYHRHCVRFDKYFLSLLDFGTFILSFFQLMSETRKLLDILHGTTVKYLLYHRLIQNLVKHLRCLKMVNPLQPGVAFLYPLENINFGCLTAF